MRKRVGIPRGLFYYQYYPLWKTFLEELGAEIIVSDNTNKKILDDGVKMCIDEACLPVKIFHGHVINLKDKVDYLFIPRYTSVSRKEYVCPKFGGLPDMIRHTFTDLPQIIDTEVNLRKSKSNSIKAAIEIGKYFTEDIRTIKKAYRKAMSQHKHFRQKVKNGNLPCEIFEGYIQDEKSNKESEPLINNLTENNWRKGNSPEESKLNIALIGHGYNIYDNYVNMDVIYKLKKLGAEIITVDMIDGRIINEKSNLLNKKVFWYFGTKVMGSIYHLLDRNDISGIIYVMSFGCGIDSFMCDLAERKIRRNKDIPFIVLTIDEHSGEAGLNTRIEAFIDMIKWRNSNESNFSPYGEFIYLY
jgi:predicted nucleotide-binding protein (sugar kinase/HSP70/actin superfamily)